MRKSMVGTVILLGAVLLLATGCPNDMSLASAGGSIKQEPGTCTFMIRKFNDLNGNGELDANDPPLDEEIYNWPVYWQAPGGDVMSSVTPIWCLEANGVTGEWVFWEGSEPGWVITGVLVNWEPVVDYMGEIVIDVTGAPDETYEIIFLNTNENGGEPPEECNLFIRKINDLNQNGIVDPGEPELDWPVVVTDPNGAQETVYTPTCINAEILGSWTLQEEMMGNWFLTGIYVNGVLLGNAFPPTVQVEFTCQEEYEVVFLNASTCPPPPGQICATKVYDPEADGWDEDDLPIEGFLLCLWGMDLQGSAIGPLCEFTGPDGVVCWTDLPPGYYEVCEVLPEEAEWFSSMPECVEVELEMGESEEVFFANFCADIVCMHTKGWWQNKHGCAAIAANPGLLDALNGLPPFMAGTIYTKGRDQCTGARCLDVELPFDSNSELGCYIVAPNNQSPVLGLAQQLAAFVCNVLNETGSLELYFPDLDMTAQEIVEAAVMAWDTGMDVSYWQTIIDCLNNAGEIPMISPVPCEIVYENNNDFNVVD